MITIQEIAQRMNGKEFLHEMDGIDEKALRREGIVVVYGYSDDNIELRGAISEEIGAPGFIHLTKDGLVENYCGNADCPYFYAEIRKATPIHAIFDKDGYSWVFETTIPHETFEIMEDGEKYCRGIVFFLEDVK